MKNTLLLFNNYIQQINDARFFSRAGGGGGGGGDSHMKRGGCSSPRLGV